MNVWIALPEQIRVRVSREHDGTTVGGAYPCGQITISEQLSILILFGRENTEHQIPRILLLGILPLEPSRNRVLLWEGMIRAGSDFLGLGELLAKSGCSIHKSELDSLSTGGLRSWVTFKDIILQF